MIYAVLLPFAPSYLYTLTFVVLNSLLVIFIAEFE